MEQLGELIVESDVVLGKIIGQIVDRSGLCKTANHGVTFDSQQNNRYLRLRRNWRARQRGSP